MQTCAAAPKNRRSAMSYRVKEFGRGRICVEHDALKSREKAAAVRAFLGAVDGVNRVEVDEGVLLLEYDAARLGHGDLFQIARRLEALTGESGA